jgi:acylphosphatase
MQVIRVRISGRVQGVWYRDWTRRTAQSLGLTGWVRNCRDKSVEALFCGPEPSVRYMIERCHEGSPQSHVERVEIIGEGSDGVDIPADFTVRATA